MREEYLRVEVAPVATLRADLHRDLGGDDDDLFCLRSSRLVSSHQQPLPAPLDDGR